MNYSTQLLDIDGISRGFDLVWVVGLFLFLGS